MVAKPSITSAGRSSTCSSVGFPAFSSSFCIAALKPGSILINVARGPLVDETALVGALQSGHLAGAALDVFDTQPLPQDHPLLTLPNVILTPHMAGITEESMFRMGQGVVAEARRILAGELPVNLVNPDVVPRYRRRFPA
jgi:D-3-phosphoglycerate dehydrogenase